jgi:hypothetical protein
LILWKTEKNQPIPNFRGLQPPENISLTEMILMIPYVTSMTKEKKNETQSSFSASSEISMEDSFVRRRGAF